MQFAYENELSFVFQTMGMCFIPSLIGSHHKTLCFEIAKKKITKRNSENIRAFIGD